MSSHVVLPFARVERMRSSKVLGESAPEVHDGISVDLDAPHATTLVTAKDRGTTRQFVVCLTCQAVGLEVAREVFTEDADRSCPVRNADVLFHELMRRIWGETVGHARRAGQREGEQLAAMLAAARR